MRTALGRTLGERWAAIDADVALRRYASLLALLHPLTAWAWLDPRVGTPVPQALAPGKLAICLPFLPSCADLRVLSSASSARVVAYGLLGIAAAVLWWRRRPKLAGALHLALEAVQPGISRRGELTAGG